MAPSVSKVFISYNRADRDWAEWIAEDVTKDEGVYSAGWHRRDPFQKLVVPKGRGQ